MMDNKNAQKFTVQGGDTPVPVGSVGVRTGHTRPSSSDCPNQGKEVRDDKGKEDMEVEAFKKSDRMVRSPIKKAGRTASCTDISDIDKERRKELETDKKRKRSKSTDADGEGANKTAEEEEVLVCDTAPNKIKKLIEDIGKEVGIISQVAKERNTKREIKDAAVKLRKMLSEINKISMVENEAREMEQISKLRKENLELRKTIQELRTCKEHEVVTEEMLAGEISFEKFEKIEHLKWPEDVFKAALPETGSPLTVRKDVDHLVVYEEGKDKEINEEILKAYEERYPELGEMEDKNGALKIATSVVTRERDTAYSDKWILWSEIGDSKEEWFRALETTKDMMTKAKRKKLSVYSPGFDAGGNLTRKMLEYLFRGTTIKCLLHIEANNNEKQDKEGGKDGRSRRDDALIVSQSGRTYKDLLKVLKEKVKPESTAAKAVKTIRESRDGRMIIVLNKDGGAAVERLEEEIKSLEEVKIKRNINSSDETVFIRDIDSLTSKEEIIEAISEETGLDQEHILVGEFRNMYGGNRAVTVRLPRGKADRLSGKQYLRIGLSMCPIRERVEVTRCFRCWRYDHIAKDCKEEDDSSKLCRKCGGEGHVAVDCTKQDWCLTCRKEGHTTGTGACPEFRKAIARCKKRKALKRR